MTKTSIQNVISRGKRKDNGEWVTGFLLKGLRTYIITPEAAEYMVVSTAYHCSVELIEVEPESVGQWIGLCDCQRTPIFDGDIVRNHMGFLQVVLFEKGCYVFIELLDFLYGERQGENFCSCSKRYIEEGVTADVVINNIHDSKDLLEKHEELDWNDLKKRLHEMDFRNMRRENHGNKGKD